MDEYPHLSLCELVGISAHMVWHGVKQADQVLSHLLYMVGMCQVSWEVSWFSLSL